MWWLWLFVVVNGEKFRFENQNRPKVIFILANDYGFNDISYHGSEIKLHKWINYHRVVSDLKIIMSNRYAHLTKSTQVRTISNSHKQGLPHQLIWRGLPSGLPNDTEILPEALRGCGYRTLSQTS